ncbi:MAG: DUF3151 family protein [Actinobacteria bacterium]|nr:DUF3151 family protein [Actinomycetota bacterium]
MTDRPVALSTTGPPETVLDPEPTGVRAALAAALSGSGPERRDAVAAVAAGHPRSLDAWAALGDLGRDATERYAAYRVGYHRGLDTLRASGWRGSGYVRWAHESNRGFLRSLHGLATVAAVIGEDDEAQRCELFLRQLDPAWPPSELA